MGKYYYRLVKVFNNLYPNEMLIIYMYACIDYCICCF